MFGGCRYVTDSLQTAVLPLPEAFAVNGPLQMQRPDVTVTQSSCGISALRAALRAVALRNAPAEYNEHHILYHCIDKRTRHSVHLFDRPGGPPGAGALCPERRGPRPRGAGRPDAPSPTRAASRRERPAGRERQGRTYAHTTDTADTHRGPARGPSQSRQAAGPQARSPLAAGRGFGGRPGPRAPPQAPAARGWAPLK